MITSIVSGLQIFVDTPTGSVITLDVEPSDTIGGVKHLINEKEGISPDDQVLTFEDNELVDDNRTLSEYNIVKNSRLYLVINLMTPEPSLRGGKGKKNNKKKGRKEKKEGKVGKHESE